MLNQKKIDNAMPAERPYKLTDERGMYLLVNPNGSRWWRLKYRLGGKEKSISLGVYPDVSLKRAREKRDEARSLVADGSDPSRERQQAKLAGGNTLATITEEWFAIHGSKLAAVTQDKARWLLSFLLPKLGSRPIASITAPEVLEQLRAIEAKGLHETATRAKQRLGQIFRFAIATGRAERDVTADLRGALTPVTVTSHAAVTDPAKVGELLRAIDGYVGYPASRAAARLAPLLFVRPGELRAAEWSEFDLTVSSMWRIPGPRMKMGEPHLVPLATQAIAILKDLHQLTGRGKYVFPSIRTHERPMSENTVNAALRRLGYTGDEMTAHGFRAMASTLLNEQGFAPDVIELQLAHQERNKVRAAYNRAQRLDERRKMMQSWADYLDELRAQSAVP